MKKLLLSLPILLTLAAAEERRVYEIDLARSEKEIAHAKIEVSPKNTREYFFYNFIGDEKLVKIRLVQHGSLHRQPVIFDFHLVYEDEVDVIEREADEDELPALLLGEFGETEIEDSFQINPTAKHQKGVPILGKQRDRAHAVKLLREALSLEAIPLAIPEVEEPKSQPELTSDETL